MNELAERRPLVFAWLVEVFMFLIVPLLGYLLTIRPPSISLLVAQLMGQALLCIPAVWILMKMGWWQEVGFNRPAAWRNLQVLLALPVLFAPLYFLAPIEPKPLPVVLGYVLLTLMIGFEEEAIWRGIIMRALLPKGVLPAVFWSSFLFGIVHFGTIFLGANPAYSLLQVVASLLGGVPLAAIRLRTNSIWPGILLHALNDFTQFMTRSEVTVTTTPSPMLVAAKTLLPLAVFFWGLWLLRNEWRQQGHRIAG
jgi:membrane protease YdiL (CAAX protease family)